VRAVAGAQARRIVLHVEQAARDEGAALRGGPPATKWICARLVTTGAGMHTEASSRRLQPLEST